MRRTHGKLVVGSLGAMVPVILAATLVYACTNYVGVLQVWGDIGNLNKGAGPCSGTAPNGTCTSTAGVVVTGDDGWNGLQAMTQSVSSGLAYATAGTGGFYVEAETSGTNSLNQNGTGGASIWYDVNTIPIGYPTSHTQWGGDPSYDCMSWNMNQHGVVNRGSVQIDTTGKIVAAKTGSQGSGTTITLFDSTDGIAGPWSTSGESANNHGSTSPPVPPAESGVCLSDSTSTNGNQAPLTLV